MRRLKELQSENILIFDARYADDTTNSEGNIKLE